MSKSSLQNITGMSEDVSLLIRVPLPLYFLIASVLPVI